VRVALFLCVALYLTYSSFGVAHPCLWGHMGHHEAEYMMRVRTTFRHHMVTPATHGGYDVPPWNDYYFHHPIGYHHLLGAYTAIVGDHIWTPTSFPALTGLLVIFGIYSLVRRYWSREVAVVAVAAWVCLPIVCSFSILTDAMFPAMACSIWTVRAWVEFSERPTRKWLLIALLAQFIGGMLFWEAYFQAAMHGLMALVWWATPQGRKAKLGRWPAPLAWLLSTGALAVATFAFHFVFMWAKGMWADFFVSFGQRHTANFDFLYSRHKQWLEILYGWPLLGIGAAWLLVFLGRAVSGRARRRDQAVLAFFVINSFYIYMFANGSALHLYRVWWYSSFLALAVADLASDLFRVIRWAINDKVALGAVTLLLSAYFVVEGQHAYKNLLESRVMMGTHGHVGYNADYPKQLFGMEVARRTGPEDFVFGHANMPRRLEFQYYMDRSTSNIASLAQLPEQLKLHPRALVVMDGYPSPTEKKLLYHHMKKHPAWLIDRYLLLDLRSDRPEFREYVFQAQPMSAAWHWFVSHRYPPMAMKEVGTIYSACVASATGNAPPAAAPEPPRPPWHGLAQIACYHNYQLVRGKPELAAALRSELVARSLPRDAKLPFGKLFALHQVTRQGAEAWIEVTTPMAPPARGRFVLRAAKGAPAFATLSEAGDVSLADTRAGQIYPLRLTWGLQPGKYALSYEPGLPYASIELGEIEIK
jgi:hypothetical protein